MINRNFFIIFFLVIFCFLSLDFVLAAPCPPDGSDTVRGDCIPNPLGTESVEELIGRIIKAILGVVGSLALLMFVYGGLTWMTASGNKEKVEKGKEIIIWATLGLVVIFSSYVLVEFVIDALTTK